MNKKDLDKTYNNLKSFIEKAGEDTMGWLKKHKKLVVVGSLMYLAFSYLFGEEEDE